MSRPLPRVFRDRERVLDERKLARIVIETGSRLRPVQALLAKPPRRH